MDEEAVNGLTFDQWMKKIDLLFEQTLGLGYENFPDWCYYDNWSDGMTPEETFADYFEEQGYQDET